VKIGDKVQVWFDQVNEAPLSPRARMA